MNDNSRPEAESGDGPYFDASDFEVFDKNHRREPLYNERRGLIKEKLIRLHERVYPTIRRRGWGVHPHWHKGWLVSAWYTSPHMSSIPFMRLRYSKPKRLVDRMEKLFLDDFGRFHAHAMLAFGLDQDVVGIELIVPSAAWVDGQNLRGKLVGAPEAYDYRHDFSEMVSSLGYRARVQIEERSEEEGLRRVWGKRAKAFAAAAPLATALAIYQPGKHSLRIGTWYSQSDRQLHTSVIAQEVVDRFEELYPLYEFIAWEPQNDYRRHAVKKWPRAASP
jgi:hypothetical protein